MLVFERMENLEVKHLLVGEGEVVVEVLTEADL
jgi:hypothetical protein